MRSRRAGLRAQIAVLAVLLSAGLSGLLARAGPGAGEAAPTSTSARAAATPTTGDTTAAVATSPSTTTVTRTVTPSATAVPTVTRTLTSTSTSTISAPATTDDRRVTATATATVTRAPAHTGSQTSGTAIAIAIGVLLLAAAGLGYFLVHRGRTGAHSTEPEWDAHQNRLQRTASWFGGQAEYLTAAATRTETDRRWGDAQGIVVDLERSLAEAEQSAPDRTRAGRAAALAQAVTGLRAAIESDLRLRAEVDTPESGDRADEAARRVEESRRRLEDVLSAPPPVTPDAAPS